MNIYAMFFRPERAKANKLPKAFALSGLKKHFYYLIGRCPTLLLKPFQGNQKNFNTTE
jgi:hypothetical protein